jgi:hypothetical protein
VRTSLNLSAIFRAIGVRDRMQTVDLVDLLQPTVQVADVSGLGAPILPPTSLLGGRSSGISLSHGFFHIFPPPGGMFVKAIFGVADSGGAYLANAAFVWTIQLAGDEVTETTSGTIFNSQAGTQPSRAVARAGTTLDAPTQLNRSPMGAARGGGQLLGEVFVPGGSVWEALTFGQGQEIWVQAVVRDAGVDPLPDSATASTP